ncbi:MAG: hypothetical protein PHW32_03695 [Bacilli bacterium]|nr:hypothetical protein [Bacilli bacterium]MDD4282442.1 hypothetical protein [Bacilli bacterium]MDD4718913.1 hypothetical protein [Bacilli bacterium]
MKKQHYILMKKTNKKETFYIDYEKMDGYKVTPKNKVKYDGIIVNKLIVIKPSFTKKLLIKKSKRKLEEYLQYIINIMDNDDSTDSGELNRALNSLERYRRTVMNTYRMYLDDKYYKLLLQKIDLIEQELSKKLYIINSKTYAQEDKKGKSR